MAKIDNHTGLEYNYSDNGGDLLLFFNGFRMKQESWNQVLPSLSESFSTLTFNRAGVGNSAKATQPQRGDVVVEQIHQLITSLNITQPFTLVAHSLGGIFALLYRQSYPDLVKAVVLVESSHPDEIKAQKEFQPPWLIDRINSSIKSIEKLFDPLQYSEDEEIESTLSLLDRYTFELPLMVLSGTHKMPFVPKESFELHLDYQHKLLEFSTNALQIECSKSGHFPMVTEPEVVIQSITNLSHGNNSVTI
jgi:pimeloyl-ACP methyl ester carboxylesterase